MKTTTTTLLGLLLGGSLLLGGCAAMEDAADSVGDVAQEQQNESFWDRAEGNWDQFAGSARERWGELTDDEVMATEGRRDQLIGSIQEKYGIARDAAAAQVEEWAASLEDAAED